MTLTTTTIIGTVLRPNLAPAVGSLVFTSFDTRFVDTPDDLIGGIQPISTQLDVAGYFSQDVIQTTDGYMVTPNIDGVTFASPSSYRITPVSSPFYLGGTPATTPSFFYVTGTWTNLDGTPASGHIDITPVDFVFSNNGNTIFAETISTVLDANGHVAVKLAKATSGYVVVENIDGVVGATPYTHTIAGTAHINLSGGPIVTVPDAPFSVVATVIDGELTVMWTPPTSDGGLPVLNYTATITSTQPTQTATIDADSLYVATFGNVTSDIMYTVSVVANNDVGSSVPTVTALIAPVGGNATSSTSGGGSSGGTTAPLAPSVLSVTAANEAVFVNWKAPASGSMPVFYVVTCTGQPGQVINATGATWEKTIFYGLTNGTPYTVTVATGNVGGTSTAASTSGTPTIQKANILTAAGDRISGYTCYSNASLTPNSTTHFTTNTTLYSQLFNGGLGLSADSGVTVTLIGCKVQSGSAGGSMIKGGISGSLGSFVLKYCEVDGSTGALTTDGAGNSVHGATNGGIGGNLTYLGCYIHNVGGLFITSSNLSMKYCYETDLTANSGSSPDGVFINQGNNHTIIGNYIRSSFSGYLATVTEMQAVATLSNVTISNNFVDGGLFGLAISRSGSTTVSPITYTNNRFLRSAQVSANTTLGGGSYSIGAVNIPTGTPTNGTIYVGTDANGWQAVNYSGISGGVTFTGCSGGTGKATVSSGTWNSAHTYAKGDTTNRTLNGILRTFVSLANTNLNHDPDDGAPWWALTNVGAIRIGSATNPTFGGMWPNAGVSAPALLLYTPSPTWTHSGNVYDDGGGAVPGL